MIGYLRGQVVEKTPPFLLIDVAGIGYEVEASLSTFSKLSINSESILYTHLVVREDAQLLYGFSNSSERDLFRELIKINGIGPKMGLSILSVLDIKSLIYCVQKSDISILTRVPGIGKKIAMRLLVEIQGRIDKWITESNDFSDTILSGNNQDTLVSRDRQHEAADATTDATHALISLGYKRYEARKVLDTIKNKDNLSTDELIRQALKAMG